MHNLDPDVRRRLIEEYERSDVAQNWEMLREAAWKRLSETFGEADPRYWEMSTPEARKLAWYDPRPPMEPDPEWVGYFERVYSEALAWFEDASFQVQYRGESPLQTFVRRQGRVDEDGSVYGSASRRLGVSRQEVNLSREAMDLLASALDTTLEHYGTSEHADPRGYWMKLDGETS